MSKLSLLRGLISGMQEGLEKLNTFLGNPENMPAVLQASGMDDRQLSLEITFACLRMFVPVLKPLTEEILGHLGNPDSKQ